MSHFTQAALDEAYRKTYTRAEALEHFTFFSFRGTIDMQSIVADGEPCWIDVETGEVILREGE